MIMSSLLVAYICIFHALADPDLDSLQRNGGDV